MWAVTHCMYTGTCVCTVVQENVTHGTKEEHVPSVLCSVGYWRAPRCVVMWISPGDKCQCNLSDKYALVGYQPHVLMPYCTPFVSDISCNKQQQLLTSHLKPFYSYTYAHCLPAYISGVYIRNLVYFTFHVCIVMYIH